ncbi:hypothetical protein J25TS5_15000 [Paenibacillus faecis]|nr:hypothetical protein J25TS5_15000 [Paenibacillus faecis]
MRNEVLVDPFYQDVPWDIIYDDKGNQIGEVYVLFWPELREGDPRNENYGDRSRNKLRRMGNDGAGEADRFRPTRLYRDKNA